MALTSVAERHPRFVLVGHRGACGLQPENTLDGFAAALEIGVSRIELDVGVTKDRVVVVTHDRRISPAQCPSVGSSRFAGRLIRDLTYDQIRKLGCGIPSLSQVYAVLERFGADDVQVDVETKTDPTVDHTVDHVAFVREVLAVVRRHDAVDRSLLQSFDWRTLLTAKRELPTLRTVAIAQAWTIHPGTPWTAGIPIAADAWSAGTLAAAVESIGACGISANYPEITDALVDEAHRRGLWVVTGTINDAATMAAQIERGVDGIVTDYPNVGRQVLAAKGLALPPRHAAPWVAELGAAG